MKDKEDYLLKCLRILYHPDDDTWNPLENDADSFNLATYLELEIKWIKTQVIVVHHDSDTTIASNKSTDSNKALRTAICLTAFGYYNKVVIL